MSGKHASGILPSTMRLRTTLSAVLASLLASACVVVPVTITEGDSPDCPFVTHHMELKTIQLSELKACDSRIQYANIDVCQVAVIASAGVTAASAIVSGSIVVIGNVGYWAERRVGCWAPAAASAPARS